jgi:hypothetical protein
MLILCIVAGLLALGLTETAPRKLAVTGAAVRAGEGEAQRS